MTKSYYFIIVIAAGDHDTCLTEQLCIFSVNHILQENYCDFLHKNKANYAWYTTTVMHLQNIWSYLGVSNGY